MDLSIRRSMAGQRRFFQTSRQCLAVDSGIHTDAEASSMLNELSFFAIGYSWGGFESLAMHVDPGKMRSATTWTGKGHLIRLHIGLENPDDLIDDLKRGLEHFSAHA
ncbi:hypothetical protein CUJ91_31685 (plasmid) [Paraburkholderia graminis]|nr:hypothetical protein CUJ91_31685 [Paraburkholderia graminis]